MDATEKCQHPFWARNPVHITFGAPATIDGLPFPYLQLENWLATLVA